MAVPTTDELYDYLTEVIDAKTSDGQHTVFDWEYLNAAAFRHFKSTSNAIGKRMKELLADGRLVGVAISNNGFVHFDHEEFKHSMFFPVFTYHDSGYHRPQYGFITDKRPQNHSNPWANGTRHLYTTKPWLDAMIAAFLEAKKRRHEAERKKQADAESRTKDALNAIAPDAWQLLERLDEVVPGIEKRVRSRSFAVGDRVHLGFDLLDVADINPFLDILRRGLPDVPRETSKG